MTYDLMILVGLCIGFFFGFMTRRDFFELDKVWSLKARIEELEERDSKRNKRVEELESLLDAIREFK